jgi:short-subunit dehydrogenase
MHVAITGASAGIGEALARAWMRPGHALTLVARREGPMEALRSEAESRGARGQVFAADMADLERATGWIDAAEAGQGPIDVLVLNAGIQHVARALDLDDAAVEHQLRVNTMAPLRLARRVAPGMVARGRGTIVVVSSVAGLTHTPMMADYSASKAAVAAFFETLRVELQGTGVHIVTVYPGPVATAMERAARDRIGDGLLQRTLPTGQPEVLATRIVEAVERRLPRVVYPSFYELSRLARTASQWLTWKLAPRKGS